MKYAKIVEWEVYQHYKHRNPPWIKLHRDLLTSRTWVSLNDSGRVLAVACMLLAAQTGNKIPIDEKYLRRVAYLEGALDLEPLLKCGFIEMIEDGSNVLAHASNLQAVASVLQASACAIVEQEQELKKEKRPPNPRKRGKGRADWIFEFPAELDTDEFKKAWHQRVQATKTNRSGLDAHLERCAEMGHARALAAIRHSMTYQGLFEPNGNGAGAKSVLRAEEKPDKDRPACGVCGKTGFGVRSYDADGKGTAGWFCDEHKGACPFDYS